MFFVSFSVEGGIRAQLGLDTTSKAKREPSESEKHVKESFKKGRFIADDVKILDPSLNLSSSSSKNAARDVKRSYAKESGYPEVYCAEIGLWDPQTCTRYTDIAHFLLITEVFDMVTKQNPNESYNFIDPSEPLYQERVDMGGEKGATHLTLQPFHFGGTQASFMKQVIHCLHFYGNV